MGRRVLHLRQPAQPSQCDGEQVDDLVDLVGRQLRPSRTSMPGRPSGRARRRHVPVDGACSPKPEHRRTVRGRGGGTAAHKRVRIESASRSTAVVRSEKDFFSAMRTSPSGPRRMRRAAACAGRRFPLRERVCASRRSSIEAGRVRRARSSKSSLAARAAWYRRRPARASRRSCFARVVAESPTRPRYLTFARSARLAITPSPRKNPATRRRPCRGVGIVAASESLAIRISSGSSTATVSSDEEVPRGRSRDPRHPAWGDVTLVAHARSRCSSVAAVHARLAGLHAVAA